MNKAAVVDVILQTAMGDIEIAIFARQAPMSARAFLSFVDDGSFTRHGAFYRVVRNGENDTNQPFIDVIQGGWWQPPSSLPPIEHESTRQTGLRHLDGIVSLARGAVGTATGAAFFICIGDQPELDEGGARNPDRHGCAAFGRVTAGMNVVRAIHQQRTGSAVAVGSFQVRQLLDAPVRITRASRR